VIIFFYFKILSNGLYLFNSKLWKLKIMKHRSFPFVLFVFLSLHHFLCYPGTGFSSLLGRSSSIPRPNPSFLPHEQESTKENYFSRKNKRIHKEESPRPTDLLNLGKTTKDNPISKKHFYFKKHIVLKKEKGLKDYTDEDIINYLKLHLEPSKKANLSINSIEIEHYKISLHVLKFIVIAFPNLEVLKLHSCNALKDVHIKVIADLPHLTHLTLRGLYNGFTDEGIQALTILTKLTELCLFGSKNSFTDEGLKSLTALAKLTQLSLDGDNSFTDEGLKSLTVLTKLTQLCLYGANSFTDEGLKSLTALTKLTQLSLGGDNNFTDEGLKSLSLLTELTWLVLCGANSFTDEGLKSLTALTKLTHLILYGANSFTDEGLKSLTVLIKLIQIFLYGQDNNSFTDEGFKSLTVLTELTCLCLESERDSFTTRDLVHLKNKNMVKL
jgi:hypothetical protein